MGIYVIAPCVLRNTEEKKYITEVLIPFTQENTLKAGIDKGNKIVSIYGEIAEEKPGIASWLSLMSYKPSSFEEIVELPDIKSESVLDFFLFVCKSVNNQKKMIVYSHQSLSGCEYINESSIRYLDTNITVYDRDEAIEELKQGQASMIIRDSIIATDGAKIKGVRK
jgi:hypothetical protein